MQSKKIALTGGIGSGKSTALEIIKKLGYPVFSCDRIYAELCEDGKYLEKLSDLFPNSVTDGKLNREFLSEKVFSDEKALATLNALSHPLIMERLLALMERYPVSFAEVPLLFEEGLQNKFDAVIVVARERPKRIAAVKARSGLTEEEVLARMARQFPYENLPEGCLIVENNGALPELESAIKNVLRIIL